MQALRQEALQIVNDVPDNLLAALVENLKHFKSENKYEIYARKAAAMKSIKEWQERNRAILESGIDWDKEIELAVEEKYGNFA